MEEDIMTNEEVFETTEGIVKAGFKKNLKIFGLGAASVVVGGIAYKYAVKPAVAKIREKRAAKKMAQEEHEQSENGTDTDPETSKKK